MFMKSTQSKGRIPDLHCQITFETPVGDRGALVLDDAYLWSTNDDAAASVLDGDNEVLESSGALVCSNCQVMQSVKEALQRLPASTLYWL